MYKGNNPTALNSQKMLLDSLNELLKEKEFKDISVSELCNYSGISRQTFYSLFGTKENMLVHQLESVIKSQQPKQEKSLTLMEMCENYSKFVMDNYEQIKMLIDNGLLNLLNVQFCKTMYSCHQSYVNLEDDEREYASLFLSAGLCYLTQKYIVNHDQLDPKELAQLSYKIMSGSIYRI